MKVIYNSLIPFRGFVAINLFGILFVRKEFKGKIQNTTLWHEKIHTAQIRELAYVGFYAWYLIEWIIRLFMSGNAYRNISFEREAGANARNGDYLNVRKCYQFLCYLRKK